MATSFAVPGGGAEAPTFDSVFDSAIDSTAPDTPVVEDAPADTGEAPAEDAAPADTEAAPDYDGDEQPEQTEQDGRNAYKMSEAHMASLATARDYVKAVQDILPTPEAAQEAYQTASDFRAMEMDFRNPQALVDLPDGRKVPAVDSWMDHWNTVSPEGMAAVGERMLGFLDKSGNQPVIRAIESQVSGVLVNRSYSAAQQAVAQFGPDSQQAKQALYKAQSLDYAVNGSHRTLDQLPKQDPNQRQMSELQRREQDLNQRVEQAAQAEWKKAEGQFISGPKEQALNQQVDKVLDPLKDKFTPKVFQSMRKEIVAEAQSVLQTRLFEWSRNHQLEIQDIQREFQKAQRTGQKTDLSPRVRAVVSEYANHLARIIPSVAKPYIADATKLAVSQNQELHNRSAAASRQSAPSGGGKASPRSVVPQKDYGSASELLSAVLG